MQTLNDCSDKFTKPSEQESNKPLHKTLGKLPTEHSGCYTAMFLFCELVENEFLGDTQSALERTTPLNEQQNGGSQQQHFCWILGNLNDAALSSLALSLSRFRSAPKLAT